MSKQWQYRWRYEKASTNCEPVSEWYDYHRLTRFDPAPGVELEWREKPEEFVPGFYRARAASEPGKQYLFTVWPVTAREQLEEMHGGADYYERVEVRSVES